jgi:hypothetical protein
MGIMTARAFCAGVMLIGVNALDFRSLAGGIGKIGMAPEAEIAAPVEGKFRGLRRMLPGRSMAVFTLDYFVGG